MQVMTATTTDPLAAIQERLTPLRQALLEHPVYARLDGLPALRRFMAHHVFAVWDFMSLLKALQRGLCGTQVPWLPGADPHSARFVNEIVLAEETDVDRDGQVASHFELYHRAMQRCGADTGPIDRFLDRLRGGQSVHQALQSPEIHDTVRPFVEHTFQVIASGDLVAIASAFTFGREDLLPEVFGRIVEQIERSADGAGLADFRYYLDRHIELDGDAHGPMAARLIAGLCGHDPLRWQTAESAALAALQARLRLWNGLLEPQST